MNELTPVSESSKALAQIEDRFKRSDLQSWHNKVDTDGAPILKTAWRVFILIFVIGGIWATTAPLGGAITSTGRVIAEDRNRIIQHLEGGILQELHVREGDTIQKGQVIAVLDDTQVKAQIQSNLLQRALMRVQLARRRAEVAELDAIQFPRDLHPTVANHPRVLEAIVSQQEEFQAQKNFLAAGAEIIDARIRGQEGDIRGLNEVLVAMHRQLELYEVELKDYKDLLTRGAIDRTRVFATERQVVDLRARLARTNLDIMAAENNIETLGNEKRQKKLQFSKESHAGLVELQRQISQVESTVTRLLDMRDRLRIRSPENGTVFRIGNRTLGSVVSPGDSIMEIFPDDDVLTVEGQLEVRHREKVKVGQEAAVVFPGNRVQSVTQYPAMVTYVSPDVITSDRNPKGSYVIRVKLSNPDEHISNFLPGNEAQIYIKTKSQTFLDIILGPLTRFSQKAFVD